MSYTLGKLESFHRSIERELLNVEVFRSLEEVQERITQYIEHYNYVRPHHGIGGFTPADRHFGISREVER
ncbi:MAG: transposase [Clostridia bacterium]|nr:MAG: transposase [Clostridia bacterium]